MQVFRRKDEEQDISSHDKVLTRSAPAMPAEFHGARTVGDFVILDWYTAYGTIGWAHSLTLSSASALWLSDAVYGQFWDHMHEVYSALVVPLGAVNLDLAPQLQAIDLYPGCRRSDVYDVTWRQVSALLGTLPPWFHWALRDKAAITAWKPGDPPAVIPADHIEVPARPLLELAVDEPEGSPAGTVCLWLARELRRRAAQEARRDIEEVRSSASEPSNDCAYVHVAAVPAPSLRPAEAEPGETIRRAGWAQIVERRDMLAWAVANAALRWDGGKSWPAGEMAEFDPQSCSAAAEWTARLEPAPADHPPTVLERLLLQRVHSVDRGELLYDQASGYPALRRTDHLGEVTVFASIPQRISTVAPLSEVVLGGHTVWVRTSDGGLWLAPEVSGHGLSWGYSGGGPTALAQLLDRLLDDIMSPPVNDYRPPPDGLLSLIEASPQDTVTTYKRAQLLAARAG